MATSVEEVGCHLVAGEVVYRAQRYPDGVVATVVLAQRNRQAHAFYLQWFVDKTLSVALDEVEVAHVAARDGEVRGVNVAEHIEFLAHQIAAQTYGPGTEVVEYVAVYLVLVDALGQQ